MTDNALVRLVERAKEGNQDALVELLHRFRPLIRSCCQGLTWADVQDLEQELYIQLIRLVRQYEPSQSVPFDRFIQEQRDDHGDAL